MTTHAYMRDGRMYTTRLGGVPGAPLDGPVIRSPGKWEGEPRWAPYYWDLGLQGLADVDDGSVYVFLLDPDAVTFAELAPCHAVALWEDSRGVGHSATFADAATLDQWLEALDLEHQEEY